MSARVDYRIVVGRRVRARAIARCLPPELVEMVVRAAVDTYRETRSRFGAIDVGSALVDEMSASPDAAA